MSDTARDLLLALSADTARSGSDLASRSGVTRAAVWKQVEILRQAGVAIDAMPGRGYRLRMPIELLDAQRIAESLPAHARRRIGPIAVHWQIDSTNSELLRRASTDASSIAVCLAERQTQGRGRRGRAWHTAFGGALALSLRWRFDTGMASLAGLSLATGIAVVDALAACGVDGVGLKWPNDVVAGDRKLAGILVELAGDALGPCHAVIGIGINLRLDAASLAAIDQPVIDLAALAGGAVPGRNAFAAMLLAQLVAMLERFSESGFTAFADAFAAHDALRGRRVVVSAGGGPREGTAAGVDALGRLRVACDGAEVLVDSGEVTVRAA